MRKTELRRRKPPKRSSIERKASLPRSTELMRKTRMRGRSDKYQDIPIEVRAEVAARSRGMCEAYVIGGDGCGSARDGGIPLGGATATHMHHRLMRSQGGKHTAENLLHVCSGCHREIHLRPTTSYQRGWLIRGNRSTNGDDE